MYDKYFRANTQCYQCKYFIPNFFIGYCDKCQDVQSDDYCSYYENKEEDKEE